LGFFWWIWKNIKKKKTKQKKGIKMGKNKKLGCSGLGQDTQGWGIFCGV